MAQHASGSSLAALRRWRRTVASHRGDLSGLAAIAFRPLFTPRNGLVPLDAISANVLFPRPGHDGRGELRFSAFGVHPIPWGVLWGGADECKLSKDLALRPRLRARGWRFDLTRQRTLHHAMDLFEALCRTQPHEITDLLQLPEVWAGFLPDVPVEGDGPELDGLCSRLGLSRQQLMTRRRREHQGLQLYPLDFVSHFVEQVQLFVEPDSVPAIQIIEYRDMSDTLCGFRGANEFNFMDTFAESHGSSRLVGRT